MPGVSVNHFAKNCGNKDLRTNKSKNNKADEPAKITYPQQHICLLLQCTFCSCWQQLSKEKTPSIIIQWSLYIVIHTSRIRKPNNSYLLHNSTHTVSFYQKKKKDYQVTILPCIYQTVSTPLDTGHSIGVTWKGNNALLRGNVPNSCITIFTCTYKTAGRRLQMNWLPRYSSNPLSMSLL